MEISEQSKFLAALKICRELPWMQRERFDQGLYALLSECKHQDQLWLVETLLKNFRVVRSAELDDGYREMAMQIASNWKLTPELTSVVPVAEGRETDGSQAIVKGVENALAREWRGSVFNTIGAAFNFAKCKIVLVEDFVGSGTKVNKKIVNLRRNADKKSVNIEIFVIVLAGMTEGLARIASDVGKENLFRYIELRKGITELISDAGDQARAIDAMIEMEGAFLPPAPYPRPLADYYSYSFGYRASEALYWQEGANVPNNVFPLFWWEHYCDRNRYEPRQGRNKAPISAEPFRKTLLNRR